MKSCGEVGINWDCVSIQNKAYLMIFILDMETLHETKTWQYGIVAQNWELRLSRNMKN